ncbi:MAG: sigma-70 family RNA polymerase sigma factor [Lachnospiraceae bacterium]|nr:sigma-70 family RNA polymerase sigma factor [Lachnospiraceae bacterium]
MRYDFESMSDSDIIALIQSGEDSMQSAMEYFLDKYKGLVLKRARTMYLVGGDRDDLIQEGMIGLYKAVLEFDVERRIPFQAFAARVVYQQMCNAIHASNRKKNSPLNEYISIYTETQESYGYESAQSSILDTMEANINSNPEDFLIDKENADMIEFELGKCLSDLEKKVYKLYIEGVDYRNIAKQLEKTPKAIDNALQRIRVKAGRVVNRHNS